MGSIPMNTKLQFNFPEFCMMEVGGRKRVRNSTFMVPDVMVSRHLAARSRQSCLVGTGVVGHWQFPPRTAFCVVVKVIMSPP
mmetsp:Transcript_99191/g.172113  ORF Transcript_99191/g.172113 Transcript_99191/m.172113 type:complete len:82 (+) Transcript_99191:825-1070(+)